MFFEILKAYLILRPHFSDTERSSVSADEIIIRQANGE